MYEIQAILKIGIYCTETEAEYWEPDPSTLSVQPDGPENYWDQDYNVCCSMSFPVQIRGYKNSP